MLRDKERMTSYHRAIMSNPEDFSGKVVLDVGSGTGVLACWCARAGARKGDCLSSSFSSSSPLTRDGIV